MGRSITVPGVMHAAGEDCDAFVVHNKIGHFIPTSIEDTVDFKQGIPWGEK